MPTETTRSGWRAAADALAERNAVLAGLYAEHGAPTIGPGPPPSERFAALANAITFQQLAGAAAAAIWARVQTAVGNDFTPEAVLAAGPEVLRSAGLSTAKATSMLDLADRSLDGTIDWARIQRLSDDEVVDHLTVVRGIGPWTAHMFLMFRLRRVDVWPTGDYGVRVGYARAFDLGGLPSERELAALGEPWAPYRSVVAWWCWRVADTAG